MPYILKGVNMEHNPQNCPNKLLIDKLDGDLKEVRNMYHDLDKVTSNHQTEINTQYKTLISLISQQGTNYDALSKVVYDIEKKLILNDYQTQKTTGIMERLTWTVISKVMAMAIVVATLLLALFKGVQ